MYFLVLTRIYSHIAKAILLVLFFSSAVAQTTANINFVVSGFIVEGDNPLGSEATALLNPYLGEHSGLDRLSAATTRLTEALESRGYSFHRVILPPQELNNGTVRLQIVTFELGNIDITGNQHFSDSNILFSLPELRVGQAPNSRRLSRSLKIANAHSAKFAQISFSQGSELDSIDATVRVVDQEPAALFVALDNSGTEDTEEVRMTLGYQQSNLFDRDQMLTASFTTAPEDTSKASQFGISYRLPLYQHGAALEFLISSSDVDSGEVADNFEISGKGTVVSAVYTRPILTDGSFNHDWSVGVQDKLFENNLSFAGIPLGSDVRSRPLTLKYRLSNRINSAAVSGYFALVANIAGGSDNEDEDYAINRVGAAADWSVVRFGGDYSYFFGSNWRLTGRLDAQFSSEVLISGEQFGVGGMSSLRGFEERSVLGDSGINLRLEAWAPPLAGVQLIGFLDFAKVELENPQIGEEESLSPSSYGLGLRWNWKRQLSLSLDFGRISEGVGEQMEGDSKAHVSLVYRF